MMNVLGAREMSDALCKICGEPCYSEYIYIDINVISRAAPVWEIDAHHKCVNDMLSWLAENYAAVRAIRRPIESTIGDAAKEQFGEGSE